MMNTTAQLPISEDLAMKAYTLYFVGASIVLGTLMFIAVKTTVQLLCWDNEYEMEAEGKVKAAPRPTLRAHVPSAVFHAPSLLSTLQQRYEQKRLTSIQEDRNVIIHASDESGHEVNDSYTQDHMEVSEITIPSASEAPRSSVAALAKEKHPNMFIEQGLSHAEDSRYSLASSSDSPVPLTAARDIHGEDEQINLIDFHSSYSSLNKSTGPLDATEMRPKSGRVDVQRDSKATSSASSGVYVPSGSSVDEGLGSSMYTGSELSVSLDPSRGNGAARKGMFKKNSNVSTSKTSSAHKAIKRASDM